MMIEELYESENLPEGRSTVLSKTWRVLVKRLMDWSAALANESDLSAGDVLASEGHERSKHVTISMWG